MMTPDLFRRVMGSFATGVTVVTATANGETRGMTANAFMSGSLEPPLCVVSVRATAGMHDHLAVSGAFGVSILALAQEDLASHFGGRPVPDLVVDFADIGGVPTLPGAAASLTASIVATHPCGDHTIFIGRITNMAAFDREPLIYYAGRYAALAAATGPHPAPDLS